MLFHKNGDKKAEKGQGLVEYALILVLVSVVVLAALLFLGPQVGDVFSRVSGILEPMEGNYGQLNSACSQQGGTSSTNTASGSSFTCSSGSGVIFIGELK